MALSCGDGCSLCLVKLFHLAKGVSQRDLISWWLCPLLPACLIAVLDEQFNSFLLSYPLCVREIQQNEKGENLKTLFVCVCKIVGKLFKKKSEEKFLISYFVTELQQSFYSMIL